VATTARKQRKTSAPIAGSKPATEPRQRAQRFLLDALAHGPKRVTDVEEAAEKAHIDAQALAQARGELGIVTSRGNAGGVMAVQWSVPLPAGPTVTIGRQLRKGRPMRRAPLPSTTRERKARAGADCEGEPATWERWASLAQAQRMRNSRAACGQIIPPPMRASNLNRLQNPAENGSCCMVTALRFTTI